MNITNKKIGFFGSCQLHLCDNFFLNEKIKQKYNIEVMFSLPFYEYDTAYVGYKGKLDYSIFDNLDILIIEINTLNNEASSKKIIDYVQDKNIKIYKTFLIIFPIHLRCILSLMYFLYSFIDGMSNNITINDDSNTLKL